MFFCLVTLFVLLLPCLADHSRLRRDNYEPSSHILPRTSCVRGVSPPDTAMPTTTTTTTSGVADTEFDTASGLFEAVVNRMSHMRLDETTFNKLTEAFRKGGANLPEI